jgi:pimeloyl-ACP methyl ester carboxylesterase
MVKRTSKPTRMLVWVLVGLGVLTAVYFGIGAYAASEVAKPSLPGEPSGKTPAVVGLEYEDIRFISREDGLNIAAWYIPCEGASSVVMLVHGRNTGKADMMQTRFVELAPPLHEAGLAVLMIDLRGHGDSEGSRYSFGVKERNDVLAAVDWLIAHEFQPGKIGILGVSLGGASVIGAAAEEQAIGAVALDSTFADLNPLIEASWKTETGLPTFLMPGVFIMNRLMFGYDLQSVKPVEEITSIPPRPVLIIHCLDDSEVPVTHAYQLAEATGISEPFLFDQCSHAEIYNAHPDEYIDTIIPFFVEALD